MQSKKMKGTVSKVRPMIAKERLKVVAKVLMEGGGTREAFMPEREMAAILPRSILLGGTTKAPQSILATIKPILARMTEGRMVRLWEYEGRYFFSFLPWKSVRFSEN